MLASALVLSKDPLKTEDYVRVDSIGTRRQAARCLPSPSTAMETAFFIDALVYVFTIGLKTKAHPKKNCNRRQLVVE